MVRYHYAFLRVFKANINFHFLLREILSITSLLLCLVFKPKAFFIKGKRLEEKKHSITK